MDNKTTNTNTATPVSSNTNTATPIKHIVSVNSETAAHPRARPHASVGRGANHGMF